MRYYFKSYYKVSVCIKLYEIEYFDCETSEMLAEILSQLFFT